MLCNTRHVVKTGDIKQLIITEESGIAKGIRRIVAVTGHEANDITREADALETKLWRVEQTTGKAKDSALKVLGAVSIMSPRQPFSGALNTLKCLQEIGQANISLWRKNELKDRLSALRKQFDKEVKEREAGVNKAVST